MKALVTGAAGLIGAHIVQALVHAGHHVRALVRPTSRRGALEDLPVEWVVADLLLPGEPLDAAFEGCDIVFHTAAQFAYHGISQADLLATALTGTETVLRACARADVRCAVVTSSSVVYGFSNDATERDESAAITARSDDTPYGVAKLAQHRSALQLGKRLGLDVRLACPAMTLGPTSSTLGPSNGAILAYLADPFGCTFPGGCNLVSARDVADGHLRIAESGSAGEAYLLGSQNLAWRDIHTAIADLAGIAAPRMELNHTLAFLAATGEEIRAAIHGTSPMSTRQQASMVGRYYWYSHAKTATLGYAPTPARETLIETISWLAASPHVSRELRARLRLSDEIYHFRSAATEHAA